MEIKDYFEIRRRLFYALCAMALSDPIPVRFSDVADKGLAAISANTGISKAELVRIAVTDFLAEVARTGQIVQRIAVTNLVVVPPEGSFQTQSQGGVAAETQQSEPLPETSSVKYGTKKLKKPKP